MDRPGSSLVPLLSVVARVALAPLVMVFGVTEIDVLVANFGSKLHTWVSPPPLLTEKLST